MLFSSTLGSRVDIAGKPKPQHGFLNGFVPRFETTACVADARVQLHAEAPRARLAARTMHVLKVVSICGSLTVS